MAATLPWADMQRVLIPGGSVDEATKKILPLLQLLVTEFSEYDTDRVLSIAPHLVGVALLVLSIVFGLVDGARKFRLRMMGFNGLLLLFFFGILAFVTCHMLYWVSNNFEKFSDDHRHVKLVPWLLQENFIEQYTEQVIGTKAQWLVTSQILYFLMTFTVFTFVEAWRCCMWFSLVPVALAAAVSPSAGLILALLAICNTPRPKRIAHHLVPLSRLLLVMVAISTICITLIPDVENPAVFLWTLVAALVLPMLLTQFVPVAVYHYGTPTGYIQERRDPTTNKVVQRLDQSPLRHLWLIGTYALIGGIACQAQVSNVIGILTEASEPQTFLTAITANSCITTLTAELVVCTATVMMYFFFMGEGDQLLTGLFFPALALCPLVGIGVAFPLYLSYRETCLHRPLVRATNGRAKKSAAEGKTKKKRSTKKDGSVSESDPMTTTGSLPSADSTVELSDDHDADEQ